MHGQRCLSPEACIEYYCNQQSGAGSYFAANSNLQRGYGIFSNLSRFIIPLLAKAGRYFGKRALSAGRSVIQDVSDGKSFKEAARERIIESGRDIGKDLFRKMQGGGFNKRRRKNKNTHCKRRRVQDVFTS